MVKDIIVIYKIKYFDFNKFETLLSHPKNQYLTEVFLNLKEALQFWALEIYDTMSSEMCFLCQVKNACAAIIGPVTLQGLSQLVCGSSVFVFVFLCITLCPF